MADIPVSKDLLLEFLREIKQRDNERYEREHARYLDRVELSGTHAGTAFYLPPKPNRRLDHLIARLEMCPEATVKFSCQDAEYYGLENYLLPKVGSGV